MLIKREYTNKTVVVSFSVASVYGNKPLVGLSQEVLAAFDELQRRRFGVTEKRRRYLRRSTSVSVTRLAERPGAEAEARMQRRQFRKGSDVGETLAMFRRQERAFPADQSSPTDDVFSPHWRPPKFDRRDPDYGRPKAGSLTEKRGIAAGRHVGKEIVALCEVITENGVTDENTGLTHITFGELFSIYARISDKVVGMLLRARKHRLVDFAGEMLYQRQDERVVITLLKPLDDIRALYTNTDDPARCLSVALK